MREGIMSWMARNWYGDTREGYKKARGLMDVADFTPLGIGTAAYDSGRGMAQGYNAGSPGEMAASGLLGAMALGPGGRAKTKGFRAYHGSPHDFDKFDIKRILTGEGTNMEGPGLYFSEKEAVARSYRDNITESQRTVAEAYPRSYLKGAGGDPRKAADMIGAELPEVYNRLKELDTEAYPHGTAGINKYIDNLKAAQDTLRKWEITGVPEAKKGHMYEVNIDADPKDFLSWDHSLHDQPEIMDKLNAANEGVNLNEKFDLSGHITESGMDEADVAQYIAESGIPGVKYWDKYSRGSGKGTHNYVIFNDKIIEIMRKYGLAGATIGAGGASLGLPNAQKKEEIY